MILYRTFRNILILSVLLPLVFTGLLKADQSPPLEFGEVSFKHKDTTTFDDKILTSLTGISESDVFNRNIIDNAVLKLKKFYFDNGFFDTKIDTVIRLNKEDENITVKFVIQENKRYRIDTLLYKGLEKISPAVSKKILKLKYIKPQDFYNKILIIQQTNEIVDLLQNNGYMNARLRNDSGTVVKKHDAPPKKNVSVTISVEGADTVFYFGKTNINIEKNIYNVSEELVKNAIAYKEGDIYDKRKKLETEKEITKIAIVQSTRLEPQTYTGIKVDFKANVLLNKKNEVAPYVRGANIENHFYIGGGTRYIDKYFFGGGRVLTVELDGLFNSIKLNRFELSATVTQPDFLNKKTVLSDKVTLGIYNLENSKNYYIGNLTSLNYFFSNTTFYNNGFLDLNEELVRFKYDVDSSNLLTLYHSFLSTTFVHDNTNDLLSPSKGFYHSITIGNAGLLPKLVVNWFSSLYYSQFFKAYTNNRYYLNISSFIPATIFATSFKVGDIIEYGSGDKLIPVQPIYKFFSGGSNSLRGWNAKQNGILEDKLNGGKFLIEGSFELRKKLFPGAEGFKKNIKGAFFLDYGNVWETHKDFRFDQIAMAIGFGLRYDLFIGPIRIDFGFKLYDPSDPDNDKWLFSNVSKIFKNKFAVQFGIGEAF